MSTQDSDFWHEYHWNQSALLPIPVLTLQDAGSVVARLRSDLTKPAARFTVAGS